MVGRLSERRMSAKVDQTSPVAKISSAVSASGPKISMFAAKSGFVIPKNKLSGSLVPVFRGGKKAGGSDAATEESTNQVQRKTKWAPDLTQDAAVRRGRALAYQTRLDQITQQLKCGTLEVGQKQDSPFAALDANEKSSNSQVDNENLELLELERREAIGEILKFNPSYKAPPDYKPLMKEARVAIPVKDYPGFNFLGLIFGPGGETQKRLEKETGAKIQVYGTKEKLGEKVEISPPDGNEIQSAFEELYVNISAQTFEKVDAAVALMELLVTSVSGNLGAASTSTAVSGKNVIVPGKTQEAAIDQGMAQQMVGSMQTPMQDQFQYHGTWLHAGPHQSLVHPPLNSSVPILSNPVLNQSSPINSPNMPSLFGPLPASVPPSSQPLMQVLPPSYVPQTPPLGHAAPPRNFPMPVAPQPSSVQSGLPGPLPFIGSQPQSTGPIPPVRPLMPLFPHTVSSVPRPDQLLTPVGSSTGWSGASAGPPVSLGPSNIGQLPPPVVPPLGNRPVVLQPENSSSALPSSTLATNVVSPATLPSGVSNPLLSGAPVNRSAAPVFPCGPAPRVGHSPIQSSSLHATAVSFRGPTPNVGQPSPNPSMNPITVSNPIHSTSQPAPPHTSISNSIFGSLANFTPIIPAPSVGPKPLHPSSSDFTFQLQQSQNPAPQPTSPNILPSRPMVRPMVQPLVPQAPSLPVGVPNSTLQPIMQVFPRPQTHLSSAPFASNPTAISAPPRFPAFQNVGPPAVGTPLSQVRPMNFGPPRQMQNIAATFSRRPEYQMQPLQNYPFRNAQPQNSVPSNQRFNNNLPPASGKLASSHFSRQQIYDPFSPSSVSVVPNQLRGDMPNVRKQEIDPEYEDLMASVGMK